MFGNDSILTYGSRRSQFLIRRREGWCGGPAGQAAGINTSFERALTVRSAHTRGYREHGNVALPWF
jgi:hypothetical protein